MRALLKLVLSGRNLAPVAACLVATAGCKDSGSDPAEAHAALVEDLRLDANAEDFSTIRNVVVGRRGEIVVPLRQDAQIRIYDSTGKRVASVGRRGQAPGEFESIGAMGWKGDTLWVNDAIARRFTYVAPGGTFLRTGGLPGAINAPVQPEPFRGYGYVTIAAMYTDGSMLASAMKASLSGTPRAPNNREYLLISASGEHRAVAELPSFEDPRWQMEVAGLGRSIPFAARPFVVTAADGSRFAHLTTEITSADGGTYTLAVFRANGDTVFAKSFPFRGVPISAAAKDSAVAAEVTPAQFAEGPADLDKRFQQIARERMPPVYAPVQALLLGLDETIWISLRDSAEVRTTLVLDGSGNAVGTIVTSTKSTLRQATATRVWMTEVDDDDLASVVRYKVRGLRIGRLQ